MRVIIKILTSAALAICTAISSYGQTPLPDVGNDVMPDLYIDGTLHTMHEDTDTALVNMEQRLQTYRSKRKLTDEEVALIRAWYDGGVPAREIATRLGISVKTVYSRLRKNNNLENPKQDEQQ